MGDIACARPARTRPQASHSMLLLVSFRAALGTHLHEQAILLALQAYDPCLLPQQQTSVGEPLYSEPAYCICCGLGSTINAASEYDTPDEDGLD